MNKKIVIFYEEDSKYAIKPEYWYAIANAMKKSNKVKVRKFNDIKEVTEEINKGGIFLRI